MCFSCKEELKGGRTFVVGEKPDVSQPDTILDDEIICELHSLNIGIVDSIKVGAKVKTKTIYAK